MLVERHWRCLKSQADHREAVESFQAGPDALSLIMPMPGINLGIAYGKLGRYREAIEAYREALHLKPDNADAWAKLAIIYARSGNRSAALEAVKELRRYDPKRAERVFDLIVKP